jgi:glycosyltransferase involved in cell wall biosynthesis
MKNDNTLVSIIIPSYNVGKYLSDACNSVLIQTYSYWEAIIVDDGSKDNTAVVAKSYCEKDKRFRYIFQENKGLSATRKKGIDAANGKFIQLLDADDALLPERLEMMVKSTLNVEENIILYSDFWIGLNDSVTGERIQGQRPISINKDILFDEMYVGFGNMFLFIPACPLFRKTVFDNIDYDESLRSAEDWDLYLNFCNAGYKFRAIKENLIIYRHNPVGLSVDFDKMFYYSSLVTLKWKERYKLSKYYYIKRIASSLVYYGIKSLKVKKKIHIQQISKRFSFFEKVLFIVFFAVSVIKSLFDIFSLLIKKRVLKPLGMLRKLAS